MNRIFIILIFSLITQVSCAQKNLLHVVKTKNGTTVNLYSDNTWEYANAAPSKEKLSAVSYHFATASESSGSNSSSKKKTSAPRKAVAGRVYHTGPRGDCYYYSSSGGKVYVDRSYCN